MTDWPPWTQLETTFTQQYRATAFLPFPSHLNWNTTQRKGYAKNEASITWNIRKPHAIVSFSKSAVRFTPVRAKCLLNRWQLRLTAMPFHYLRPYWFDFQSSRYCNMPSKSGNGPASLDHASNSYSKQNGLSKNTREPLASIGTAAAHATFPSWMSVVLMVSLIFGGCCANVRCREVEDMREVSNC